MFGRRKRLVGLDIGSSAIKEVELKPTNGGRPYELVSLGAEPLAPDSIVDGAIMDAASVTDSIERLLSAQKIKSQDVDTSLAPLQAVSESLIAEMERTFGFFRDTSSEDRIDRILVTGGASRTLGLLALMRQRFAAQIEPLNPFRSVDCDPIDFPPDFLEEIAPSAAIAVGLAMRYMGEKR